MTSVQRARDEVDRSVRAAGMAAQRTGAGNAGATEQESWRSLLDLGAALMGLHEGGGHFLHEDRGEALAEVVIDVLAAT